MVWSVAMELECEWTDITDAVGLAPHSRFGEVLAALVEALAQSRRIAASNDETSKGFRARPKTDADGVIRALSVERLFLCDACGERVRQLVNRLRGSGVIAAPDPAEAADSEQRAKGVAAKLLQ